MSVMISRREKLTQNSIHDAIRHATFPDISRVGSPPAADYVRRRHERVSQVSRDGWLPPGVEDWHLPGNRPCDDHHESCPQHDDAEPICTCGCHIEDHPEDGCVVKSHLCEGPKVDEDPDCICGDFTDSSVA